MLKPQIEAWQHEYDRMIKHKIGTYTSTRAETPSPTLDAFFGYLKNENEPLTGRVLDVGCGVGRNAIPCAQRGLTVFGTEIILDALVQLKEKAFTSGVLDRIHLLIHDLFHPLPFNEQSFDYVLDITVSNNIMEMSTLRQHFRRLTNVCIDRGYVVFGTIDESDEFLREMLAKHRMPGEGYQMKDPRTGIVGRWYCYDEVQAAALATGKLALRHHQLCPIRAKVGDTPYNRCYNVYVWQRVDTLTRVSSGRLEWFSRTFGESG